MSEILVRHDDYLRSEERAADVCCENTIRNQFEIIHPLKKKVA